MKLSTDEIKTFIRQMAFAIGMSKEGISAELKTELKGEKLKFALQELDTVLGDHARAPRRVIRSNKGKNGQKFSQLIKKLRPKQ